MSSRRGWLLQQMGITQYRLRRPRALQGEIAVRLAAETRLVIVASEAPALSDPLIADVLRTLTLDAHQVQILTPDQLTRLPDDSHCHCWYLGTDVPQQQGAAHMTSPQLAELYHNADAKRALWQQLCHYESDFFTQQSGS